MNSPDADAEKIDTTLLYKREDELFELVTNRSQKELLAITDSYKAKYGKYLYKKMRESGDLISQDFCNLCSGLFITKIDYDCECLHDALGSKLNHDTIIEIFAARCPGTLKKIEARYKELFSEELSKVIESKGKEIKDTYLKLLQALLKGERAKNSSPSQQECEDLAKKFKELADKKKTDDALFIDIFVKRSSKELVYISRAYNKLTDQKTTIVEGINKAYKDQVKEVLTTCLYATISPSEYFATRVLKSIKGLGTDEVMLERVFISRYNVDIKIMGKYYKMLYNVDMLEDVKGDTSGNYYNLFKYLFESTAH